MKLIPLLLLFVCASVDAEVGYRLVHPDGTVEFSDQPIPGGEEIKLRQAPTIEFVPAKPIASSPSKQGKKSEQSGVAGSGSIAITSPTSDQTLWFEGAAMSVAVSHSGILERGQRIVIKLDGSEVASGQGSSFSIGEVYRGSHSLVAEVVSDTGATLYRSSPVTFHIRQHSILKQQPPTSPTPEE